MNSEILTVAQFNQLVKDVLTLGFPSAVWVCGEIQGYDRNKDKKHVFFELCEKNPGSNDIIARIGLVIFSGKKTYVEELLRKAEAAFQLKDDIEVKFLCRVDFYPPHGAVRLIVESIDPVYTFGKIAQDRHRLITFLKKNGTLDQNKALVLSDVPLHLGLITAFDSAAYNDFVAELKSSGLGFKIFFVNSLMQGKKTEKEVCRAVDILSERNDLDAIIITRGGGSIADLSCFDSQMIAEKIAACRLPVLSGIGHEINVTVTDLAAFTFVKTPTAIAQFLNQRVQGFLLSMDEKLDCMVNAFYDKVSEERSQLRDSALGLQAKTHGFFKTHHEKVLRLCEEFKHQPIHWLKERRSGAELKEQDFLKSAHRRLQDAQIRIKNYQRLIDLASPVRTLKRGFSVTRAKEGDLIRGTGQVKLHQSITTQLWDGDICSQITGTT